MKKEWQKSNIILLGDISKTNNRNKIVKDLIEYIIINNLSTHLVDYYNNKGLEKSLREYTREDIQNLLKSNISLDTFSKPMEQRKLFEKDDSGNRTITLETCKLEIGEIVSSQSNGAIYEKFDMRLYKNSKIFRDLDGSICIRTKQIDFIFSVDFHGFTTNIPVDFIKYYLKKRGILDIRTYSAQIAFKVKVRPWYLITGSNAVYYDWIDSFINDIQTNTSFSSFLNKIGWDSIPTLLAVIDKKPLRRKSSKEKGRTP